VRGRLIVALDLPDAGAAGEMVGRLGETVSFYKIGMELVYGGEGLALPRRLIGDARHPAGRRLPAIRSAS
jgi:orotidine-5'-phosphate decarboxylase